MWVAGSPCVDFSMYGTNQTVFGPTAKCLLVFFRLVLSALPGLVLLENVRQFPDQLVKECIGHLYEVEVLLTCPSQCGLPMSRPRKYMLCRRKTCFPFFICNVDQCALSFDSRTSNSRAVVGLKSFFLRHSTNT